MSRITYAPDGADPKTWDFEWSRLLSPECIAMERVTGMDYTTEIVPALARGNMLALSALLWVLLKRSAPDLRFDQVQFCLDDISIEDDEREADSGDVSSGEADGAAAPSEKPARKR